MSEHRFVDHRKFKSPDFTECAYCAVSKLRQYQEGWPPWTEWFLPDGNRWEKVGDPYAKPPCTDDAALRKNIDAELALDHLERVASGGSK